MSACGSGRRRAPWAIGPAARFSGEVASANTIAASVEAYVEALNAMLGAEAWSGVAEAAASALGGTPGGEATATAEFDDEARPIDTTEWFNR